MLGGLDCSLNLPLPTMNRLNQSNNILQFCCFELSFKVYFFCPFMFSLYVLHCWDHLLYSFIWLLFNYIHLLFKLFSAISVIDHIIFIQCGRNGFHPDIVTTMKKQEIQTTVCCDHIYNLILAYELSFIIYKVIYFCYKFFSLDHQNKTEFISPFTCFHSFCQ